MPSIKLDPFAINPLIELKNGNVTLTQLTFVKSVNLTFINLFFVKGTVEDPDARFISFARSGGSMLPILVNEKPQCIDLSDFDSCYLKSSPKGIIGNGIDIMEKVVLLHFYEEEL